MIDRMTEEQFQIGGGRRNMTTNHTMYENPGPEDQKRHFQDK